MIFENKKDHDRFVKKVAKSLKTSKSEDDDDPAGGDKIPIDKVLPPAAGRGSGTGTPNTSSKNQPYYGGSFVETVESINDRLCRLLSEVKMSTNSDDQTTQAQTNVRQGQVGTTGVLGHSKGNKPPATAAGALRQEVDAYATRGKAARAAKKEKAETTKQTKGPQKPEKPPEQEEQTASPTAVPAEPNPL